MSFEVAKHSIDYIFSEPKFNSEPALILDFIGGEPLLELSLIEDIIKYFLALATKKKHPWKENYIVRITTNGLLYSSPDVQDFIKRYHPHLSISISIDGNREKTNSARKYPDGTGSYDDVLKSIPLWRNQFPQEGTKMTISHDELPFVFESVKHLISLGIYKIDINPVLENVWKPGDEKVLEEQLIRCADHIIENGLENKIDLSCFEERLGMVFEDDVPLTYGICGGFTFAVDYKGDFYSCLRFAKFSLREKKPRAIGNVKQGVNWNLLRPFQSFCNQITSDKCIQSDLYNGCKVCPAENYDASLTATIFEQSTAACNMHKAKVKAKNYFWNKLYISRPYI